jgi:energy-coupling factor transporter ATP-binding protein EcfA2
MKLKAGKEIIDVLSLAYRSNRPVLLEGPHGVGKSELIEQAAGVLKIGFIVRDLSLLEPPDLIGLPVQKNGKTVYAPPAFLPTSGHGILAFEELNRSERYMMSPCLQLLTARCLNDYKLPPGWLPVAAINPAGKEYDTRELDPALLSRFVRIQIEPDVSSWLKWAAGNGMHESVRRYVESIPDVFATTNPRSWTYVSDVLLAYEAQGAGDRRMLTATVAGLVGDTHASAFVKVYRTGDVTLTVDAVLRKYRSVRATVKGWAKAKRTDALSSIAHSMRVALQNSDLCDEVRSKKSMTRNLLDFIQDLPADIGRKVRSAAKDGGAMA